MTKDWRNEWFTAEELMDMPITTIPNSLHLLCPVGQGMVIVGPEEHYKSTTALELAMAMSCDGTWYGLSTQGEVLILYVFSEGEPGELQDKMRRAKQRYPAADFSKVVFKHFASLSLDTDDGIQEYRDFLDTLPCLPSTTIYDPYRSCVAAEENKTDTAKNFVSNISTIDFSRHIIIHHRAKPGGEPRTMGEMARGSGVLAQWAHSNVAYLPKGYDSDGYPIVKVQFGSRSQKPKPFELRMGSDGLPTMQKAYQPPTKEAQAQQKIWELLDVNYRTIIGLEPKRMSASDLGNEVAGALGMSTRQVKRAHEPLLQRGLLHEEKQGKNTMLYVHPLTLEPDWPVK